MSITLVQRPGSSMAQRRRRRLYPLLAILALTVFGITRLFTGSAAPTILVEGLADGDLLSATGVADGEIVVTTAAASAPLVVTLDDDRVSADGDRLVTIGPDVLADLDDGEHVLEVRAGEDGREEPATARLVFVVDRTGPTVTLPEVVEVGGMDQPLAVDFTAEDASQVRSDTGEVVFDGGAGTITWETLPDTVVLTAQDVAGNETTAEAPVVVAYPGGRAVHVTTAAWQYEPKRTAVLDMIDAGLIDTVELDVKDESGDIGFDSEVELADLSGADSAYASFDAARAVADLHERGVRVVGRLVVYKDPKLAQWAWENDRRDMVTQTTDGQPYTGPYGEFAFTNFAHPEVQPVQRRHRGGGRRARIRRHPLRLHPPPRRRPRRHGVPRPRRSHARGGGRGDDGHRPSPAA